jgi:hypothetical protein
MRRELFEHARIIAHDTVIDKIEGEHMKQIKPVTDFAKPLQ